MKVEFVAPQSQDPPQPIQISREMMDRSLAPNGFEEWIFGPQGLAIGKFTGAHCADAEELVSAIRIPAKVLKLVESAVSFPCAALINIYVEEEFDRQGFGSRALEIFDEHSKSNGCLMAVLRVGYLDGSPDKNLKFYEKNGWERLDVDPSGIPWMSKRL